MNHFLLNVLMNTVVHGFDIPGAAESGLSARGVCRPGVAGSVAAGGVCGSDVAGLGVVATGVAEPDVAGPLVSGPGIAEPSAWVVVFSIRMSTYTLKAFIRCPIPFHTWLSHRITVFQGPLIKISVW